MLKRVLNHCLLLLAVLVTLSSCKPEFEKVRASGNDDLIYKKAFEYYDKQEYFKAQTLFEQIINKYRGKEGAEKLYYTYAYTHYKMNNFILASYYFKNFANTFYNSQWREEAMYMSAVCNYQLSPTYRLDQSYTTKAIDELQSFVNMFPESTRVDSANTLIDACRYKLERKAFGEANLYFDLQNYQSAVTSFENLLKDYPETNDAERIRYLICESDYLLAENSIYEKQEERYQETLNKIEEFKLKYPKSKYLKDLGELGKDSRNRIKDLKNERHQIESTRGGS
ncbi:MAG: outer membrane protein assembly factor BamD [Saprospiraceae bacterium]